MKLILILFTLLASCYLQAKEVLPELKIKKISEDVFLHQSFQKTEDFGVVGSNGLIIIEDNKAFIVDTPWSIKDTQKLINWIAEKGYKPTGSISTHSHEDRTAGIKWLNEHLIPTYASELTNELLAKKGKTIAKNTFTFPEYQLNNNMMKVYYPGGGHTIDNIVIWLPKSKILFGGCLVRSIDSKGLGYTGEASIAQWANSVNNVLSKYSEAEIVIPGHGKLGDTHLLIHTKTLAESASANSKF